MSKDYTLPAVHPTYSAVATLVRQEGLHDYFLEFADKHKSAPVGTGEVQRAEVVELFLNYLCYTADTAKLTDHGTYIVEGQEYEVPAALLRYIDFKPSF